MTLSRAQFRHRTGDQIDDALNLVGTEVVTRPQIDDHRRRGFLFRAEKIRARRDRQVDPARLHRGDGIDRARQLALQGAQIIDLLGELADAERGFLKDLKADCRRRRARLCRPA